MYFKIVSRIFDPEPSAASFRLGALAKELTEAGHEVEVLTVRPPAEMEPLARDDERGYRVRRAPVLRDNSGYVRGYLPYLSFDLPLFFRILLGRRADAIIVEPPPTTGFFVRLATALKRTPYVYYAADIWADATKLTSAMTPVVRVVAAIERWALNGAQLIVAVSPQVEKRLAEIGITANTAMVGNGIDVDAFEIESAAPAQVPPLFIYGGTVAEWHGAQVFVRAMKIVQERFPAATLKFIGGGSEKQRLQALTESLGLTGVEFHEAIQPAKLGLLLRVASASLASVRPDTPYEFAFPTKLYGSTVAGAPLIYAGGGPAVDYVQTEVDGVPLGMACKYSVNEVADAMIRAIEDGPNLARRERVTEWGRRNVGLDSVAARIRSATELVVDGQ